MDKNLFLAHHLKKEVQLLSASSSFLKKQNIQQWVDLPLWIDGNFLLSDNARITKDYGYEFRNINQTVHDLISYYATIKQWETPILTPPPLSESREKELIAELKTIQ